MFVELIALALHPKRDLATHERELPSWGVHVVKLVRYSLASLVSVICSQTILIVCNAVIGLSGVWSNLISCTISAWPNYWMNRAWTWDKHSGHSLATEVIPFWGMGFAGLGLSTIFVAYADHRWHTTLAISLANLLAFGVLWLAKYVVLDRLMFGRDQHLSSGPTEPPSRASSGYG